MTFWFLESSIQKIYGTSLVVRWLGLCASKENTTIARFVELKVRNRAGRL